jgi:beta-lactam-binding protein with PASTA domain
MTHKYNAFRGFKRVSFILSLLAVLAVPSAPAAVVYVNAASTAPAPDGTTWATAFRDLQAAANAAGFGYEVWVAAGTYTGTGDQVVYLGRDAPLYGGFNGSETQRAQRDWNAHTTIIDGQKARCCVTTTDAGSVDGFTLQNGQAVMGGGMWKGRAVNCTFVGNKAEVQGGGMCGGNATNCAFLGNSAPWGGGLDNGSATDCAFTGNTVTSGGGGLTHGNATNCVFTGNTAQLGGGVWTSTAVNSTFIENLATYQGGGAESSTVTNCKFNRNAAIYGGGAMNCTTINCVLAGNRASQRGGGAYDCTATNCTFVGNFASYGAGGMKGGTAGNCIFWGDRPFATEDTAVSSSCLSPQNAGPGNITGNPGFADPIAGDFRLRAASPCVNTGTAPGAPATDILGRARPQGAEVDMGAYEYHPEDDAHVVTLPAVLRVNAASTAATPDGLTWATAFPTLQEAAIQAGYGTTSEIWVAKGTYRGADGTEVVYLMPGTALYGGFLGGESTRDARSSDARITIIDGQARQRCVTADETNLVEGLTLKNGQTLEEGGGMYNGRAVRCVFSGNNAGDGAGAYKVTATDCTFKGNRAISHGGGMYEGTATRCSFSGNAGTGGGMAFGTATDCTFTGNDGGGKFDGTATNCLFSGNKAGGMLAGTAVNCVFSANYGGGMNAGSVTNCTLSGNDGGGLIRGAALNSIIWGNTPNEMEASSASFTCSTVVTAGTGNITVNPMFVNPAAGDFRLRAESPCVNTATETGAPALDFLGRARPQGTEVDMGAYEYYPGDEANSVIPPAVLRVNAASSASAPDGLTWATAYSTLQAAVDRAGFGAEIWVVQGTYTSSYDADQVLRLKPCVTVHGGFTGVETSRDARSPDVSATIIDGQNARPCVSANSSNVIDGFTLRNGLGQVGAGMRYGTAVNCVFTGNRTTAYGGGGMDKGTAVNCTFFGNTAAESGGGTHEGTAVNCIIWGNSPDETQETTVSFSCLSAATAGNGNIAADPDFVDSGAGDFRLNVGSPCLDAGTPDGAPSNDILNVPRPQGGGYDMGAHETVLVTVPNLAGLARVAARQMVAAAHLYVRNETEEYHLTVPQDLVFGQTPAAGLQALSGMPVDLVISKGPQPAPVPDVVGLTQEAAAGSITAAGLAVGTVSQAYSLTISAGSVLSQTPLAGTEVLPGSTIDLVVSRGGIVVPGVEGQTQSAASLALTAAELAVGAVTQEYSLSVPAGSVISQSIAAGAQVLPGEVVDLVISKGGIVMPGVEGQTQSAASLALTAAELAVGAVTRQYSLSVPAGSVISQSIAAGAQVLPGAAVDLVISKGGIVVPDVVGHAQSAAVSALTAAELVVGAVTRQYSPTQPAGSVVSQSVAAGTVVLPVTPVGLVISNGPQPLPVPDLSGQTQSAATSALTGAGLVVGVITRQYSATVPAGAVLSQDPSAGTSVLPGTAVSLVISRGAQAAVVPKVVGQPQAQAETAIAGAGLVLGLVTAAYSDAVVAGSVISQSPAAGAELPPGMTVSIVVSLGAAPAAEGEGEPVDADTAREALNAAFADADTNGDDALSFEEAAARMSGLPRAVFDELDTDGDGQLASDELGVDDGAGCTGCQGGRKAFDPTRMGDLFLMALGAMGLAVMSTLRRP